VRRPDHRNFLRCEQLATPLPANDPRFRLLALTRVANGIRVEYHLLTVAAGSRDPLTSLGNKGRYLIFAQGLQYRFLRTEIMRRFRLALITS
jgi:hypothetical protein